MSQIEFVRKALLYAGNKWSPVYSKYYRYVLWYNQLTETGKAEEDRYNLYKYLTYCRRYCNYWREIWPKRFNRFSPEDSEEVLSCLPTITKEDVVENNSALIIKPESRSPNDGFPDTNHQYSIRSGGSTGVPVEIVADLYKKESSRASKDYFYSECGLEPGEPSLMIWGSTNELSDIENDVIKRFSTWLRNVTVYPMFALNSKKIAALQELVKKNKFKGLIVFTSIAETLVEQLAQNMTECWNISSVFTGGGILTDNTRYGLQRITKGHVYNTYAGRDIGLLGHETPKSINLVVPRWMIRVEILDDNGNRVRDGESGEVHVTMMNNFAMGLIRYSTGDIAKGKTVNEDSNIVAELDGLEGRTAERFFLNNGVVIDPSAVIHTIGVVEGKIWMSKFQVIKDENDYFYVLMVRRNEIENELDIDHLESRLREHFSKLAQKRIELKLIEVKEIQTEISGKHLYCKTVRGFNPIL